jgi:hypothetical protein
MKLRISILLINLALLSSCNRKESDHNENTQIKAQDTTVQIKHEVHDTIKISEIIADDFIERVLKNDLLLPKLTKIYRPKEIHEELIPNRHYPEKTDTIVSFKSGSDFVQYHKGIGNTLPVTITIMSDKAILDGNIKTGSSKSIFVEKFSKQNLSDTLTISDLESGNNFTFIFENDKLIKIQYQAEYID